MKLYDAMIDIETLGLGLDRNFVITQIALVPFNFQESSRLSDHSYQDLYEQFMRNPYSIQFNLNITEQVDAGAVIEPETLNWWLSQNTETLRGTVTAQVPMTEAIRVIEDFASRHNIKRFWGNGKEFDNMALRQLFERCGKKFPTGFWSDMDLRTLAFTAGEPKPRPSKVIEREAHNALSDAAAQTVDALQYWQRIVDGVAHGT